MAIMYIIFFLSMTNYPRLQALRAYDYPWTYDNDLLGGPDFWGLLSKKWEMCAKGKMQSPIDIVPSSILYDPRVSYSSNFYKSIPLSSKSFFKFAEFSFFTLLIHMKYKIIHSQTTAEMINIGQMPRLRLLYDGNSRILNISGGPVKPYKYRLQRIDFHYSNDEATGSEHAINSKNFPMEIQLITYNSDLYANFTASLTLPRGIAAISIIVLLGEETSEELLKITNFIEKVPFKKKRVTMNDLKVWKLFPNLTDYITYEGSMTSPGCYETVTWIILNHPIYITRKDLNRWRKLQRTVAEEKEPQYVAPNFRPLQYSHGRLIRTNIVSKVSYVFEPLFIQVNY
ncbi:unnamed protein product [Thelazia callipaeda]|uniref:Alpha-carbonic anhydrase domain-containing protein n=1 Tax=Thelazia callipaeda TaxID=103827 RepID=A0A0N5D0A6_THECL|nr:unnamed protein product [Thelazia callipaeda]